MQLTLHLTERCNMACSYCYQCHAPRDMTPEVAREAVRLAQKLGGSCCGIAFFGVEPLLKRDLIYDTVRYCREQEGRNKFRYFFKMTTNGTLLDSEFLEFSDRESVFIALSHDGTQYAQDLCRRLPSGSGTYELLERKLGLLLKHKPYAPVLMTVNPETVGDYFSGVCELWEKGFHYIISTLNYAAGWTDGDLKELSREYRMLAGLYKELTRAEEKFYLSPFEVKIASRIQGDGYCNERCELGKKQLSVSPDGGLYPCVQFVGDEDYRIGDVWSGIDEKKREGIYARSEAGKTECMGCVVQKRCNCSCGCLNKQVTGSIDHVPAVLCEHERILMPIADALAEELFREKNGMFIQKHYNDVFPIISMVEDMNR